MTAFLLLLAGLVVAFWIKEPPSNNSAGKAKRTGLFTAWREIIRQPGIPGAYGLSFFNQLCRNMLLPIIPLFIPLLLRSADFVNTFTGLITGTSSATNTVSSVFLGRLGDRRGQRRVLIISLIISSVFFAVQSLVSEAWHLLLLQAAVGVALGGVTPSISALLARYTRPGVEGAVYGLENSIGSAARAVAPMLGSFFMALWGMRSTFIVTGVLLALTAVFAAVTLPNPPKARE